MQSEVIARPDAPGPGDVLAPKGPTVDIDGETVSLAKCLPLARVKSCCNGTGWFFITDNRGKRRELCVCVVKAWRKGKRVR